MLYLAIYAYTYMCVYMHATAINLKRAHEFENIMQEYRKRQSMERDRKNDVIIPQSKK